MRLFGSDPREAWQDELSDLSAEFEHFRSEDSARLDRARKYREEIEATRDHKRQMDFDDRVDYGRRRQGATNQALKRHSFRFPLAQALTVKHAYRIAGRMPDAFIDKREENSLENWRSDLMEKMWWGVTNESQGEAQFADAAWDASQIGAAAFEVYLDPKENLQVPRYCAVDTGSLIVVPGLSDPHEFQRIYRWWTVPLRSFNLAYKGAMFRDVEVNVGDYEPMMEGTPMATIVECCDKNRKIRFAYSAKPGAKAIGLEEWTHGYGFVPLTVIPNIGPYRRVWGWADYDFVREIVFYLGEVHGQHADIIRAVANGAYKMKGGKTTPSLVSQILQNGGVVPLGRDGELEPVEVPNVPSFAGDHVALSYDLFERLGFAPPAAWGSIGAQSGSDRGLQLQPLQELTSMKQKNFTAGLSRLGEMIFKIIEQVDAPRASYAGVARKGAKASTFSVLVGSQMDAVMGEQMENGEFEKLPRTPKELFDGRYAIRFEFADRVDYDDPAYVASEINKFVQGLQSAQTTLERLGIRNPQDELKLLEREAEDMPWLRNGMLELLKMQFDADRQGENDGSQNADPAAAMGGALDTMTGNGTAALDADAAAGALPGGGVSPLYGGA